MKKEAYFRMMGLDKKADISQMFKAYEPKNYLQTYMKGSKGQVPSGDNVLSSLANSGYMSGFNANLKAYKDYADKSFWHRLLQWIKQKWTSLSGGDKLTTERGKAMNAKENATKFVQNLEKTIEPKPAPAAKPETTPKYGPYIQSLPKNKK